MAVVMGMVLLLRIMSVAVSPEVMIALFGCILIALRVFEGPVNRFRFAYIFANEVKETQTVLPRKPSIATCQIETVVTVFFILSWLTQNLALQGFLGVLAGVLWLLQINTQKTRIWYGADGVFCNAMGKTEWIRLEDIKCVRMMPTRTGGFEQLDILLISGKRITLSQLHFSGLYELYEWLLSGKSKEQNTGYRKDE